MPLSLSYLDLRGGKPPLITRESRGRVSRPCGLRPTPAYLGASMDLRGHLAPAIGMSKDYSSSLITDDRKSSASSVGNFSVALIIAKAPLYRFWLTLISAGSINL